VVASREIGDRVDQVFELPGGIDDPALSFGVPEAAVVDREDTEARVGESQVVALVVPRVLQAEPARSLDDRPERPLAVGSPPQRADAVASAEVLDALAS